MVKVGIIGTGLATSISKGHLKGVRLHKDAELQGVYDLNAQAVEKWCDAFEVDKALIYTDVDQLINDADLLVICTPNFAHTEYILKCAEKNKHILCEKPLTSSPEDVPAIKKALQNHHGKTMVNMSYRYIPAIRMIHDYITGGKSGRLYSMRHNMGAPRLANEEVGLEWRFIRKYSGSGALSDFGSHAIDILHYLFGEEETGLEQVDCYNEIFIKQRKNRTGEMQNVENDDADMISGRLSGGGLYSLLLSRVGAGVSMIEIICSNAMIRYRMDQPDRIWVSERAMGEYFQPEKEIVSETCREDWHNVSTPQVPFECCADNMMSMIDAIENDTEVLNDFSYGIRIMEELDKLEQKANKHR